MLNEMQRAGVIRNYALFGATAQMRYTEPVATLDADVLVAVDAADRLDPEGEAIRVGAWPTQFMPAFSPLTVEAMEQAEIADFEGVSLRVVRADHLAAIALSVGRAKDFARVLALLESGSISRDAIERLAARHGLAEAWRIFERRFLDD